MKNNRIENLIKQRGGRKLLALLGCFILLCGSLWAQTPDPLRIKVTTAPGDCYDNAFVHVAFMYNGTATDTATLRTMGYEQFTISYTKTTLIGDSVYRTHNLDLTLAPATYKIGLECVKKVGDGYVAVTMDTTVTLTTSYVTPVAGVISTLSNTTNGCGWIPSLTCKPTGRLQFSYTGGLLPITVYVSDSLTGYKDTVVFSNRQTGTNAANYNYKDYFSLNDLYAGHYKLHVVDACGYHSPDIFAEVKSTSLDFFYELEWLSGPQNYYQYDSNAVYFGFALNDDVQANNHYKAMIDTAWTYSISYTDGGGTLHATDWKTVNTLKRLGGTNVSDTLFKFVDCVCEASRRKHYYKLALPDAHGYCDLYGRPITLTFKRHAECGDTTLTFTYTIKKPPFIKSEITVTDGGEIYDYDLCARKSLNHCTVARGAIRYYPYPNTQTSCEVSNSPQYAVLCGDGESQSAPYNYYFTQPLKTVLLNGDNGDTVFTYTYATNQYTGGLSYNNFYPNDSLRCVHVDSVRKYLGKTWEELHDTLNFHFTLKILDGKGCEMVSLDSTVRWIHKCGIATTNYRLYHSTGMNQTESGICSQKKTHNMMYIEAMHSDWVNKYADSLDGKMIVEVVKSPLNNHYNFRAVWYKDRGWVIEREDLTNTAEINLSYYSGYYRLSIEEPGLAAGNYKWRWYNPLCDKWQTTWGYHLEEKVTDSISAVKPQYQLTPRCTDMYIKPTAGKYEYRFRQDYTPTDTINDMSYFTEEVPAKFHIISGPSIGYNASDFTLGDSTKITAAGTYVIEMYEDTYGCNSPKFRDTVTFAGGVPEFDYEYAYVCDATSTEGSVHVRAKNGTPPYTYRLFSGPDTTTLLGANSVGDFYNMPIHSGQELAVIVKDQCNAEFIIRPVVFNLQSVRKAWTENLSARDTVCEGDQVIIHALFLGADTVTYTWTGPNGYYAQESDTLVFYPRGVVPSDSSKVEGWYKLEMSTKSCPLSLSDSVNITVFKAPSVVLTKSDTICAGETVTIKHTPYGDGSITYQIAKLQDGVVSYQSFTNTDGVTTPQSFIPYSNRTYWVNSISDGRCTYKRPEDTIHIVLNFKTASFCDVITFHDTICYDSAAVIGAYSTLASTYPQTLKWYSDSLQTNLIATATLNSASDKSYQNFTHLKADTTLFVTVSNSDYCESKSGAIFNSIVINNDTTDLTCGMQVSFFDHGGPEHSYGDNELYTHTFTAPVGSTVNIRFSHFKMYDEYDHLVIYDNATQMYDFHKGDVIPSIIETSSNTMKVMFVSSPSGSGTDADNCGWVAMVGSKNAPAKAAVKVNAPISVSLSAVTANPLAYNTATKLKAEASGARGDKYNFQWQNSADNTTWSDVATHAAIGKYDSIVSQAITDSMYYRVIVTDASADACADADTQVVKLVACPNYNLIVKDTICADALPYDWRDTTFAVGTVSGDYVFYRTTAMGCDSTVTLKLTILATPVIGSVTLAGQTICAGDSVTLSPVVSGVVGTLSYSWSTGATTSSIKVAPSATTTYKVTVTATNTLNSVSCVVSDSASATITVNTPVVGDITLAGQTICVGDTVTLTPTVTGNTGTLSYMWSNSATTTSIKVYPSATTTYKVTVTATNTLNSKTCTAKDSANATVTVNPLPTVSIVGTATPLCNATNVKYYVPDMSAGYTYAWTVPTGATYTGTTDTIKVNFSNVDGDVAVTVTDDNTGCKASATKAVTLTGCDNNINCAVAADEVCLGTPIDIAATVDGVLIPGLTVRFEFDESGIADATIPAAASVSQPVTYTTAGTKNVTLRLMNGATELSNCTTVITVKDTVKLTATADTAQAICVGEPLNKVIFTFSNATLSSAGTLPAGVTFNAAEGTLSGTPTTVGTFAYSVTAASTLGCTATNKSLTGKITVNPIATGISDMVDTLFCNGATFDVTPNTGSIPAGTMFTWTVTPNANVTGASDQTVPQASISQTLTNTSKTVQEVTYEVTPVSSTCEGDKFKLTVTLYPTNEVQIECPDSVGYILDYCEVEHTFTAADFVLKSFGDRNTTIYGVQHDWHLKIDTIGLPAGYTFGAGKHIVRWIATDECGVADTCEQIVDVQYKACPTATDYDGNTYNSVRIGDVCWTQTNLRSEHYADGRKILGRYSYTSALYPNTTENVNRFGELYDWYAAIDTTGGIKVNAHGHVQGICPDGWHLPDPAHFQSLAANYTASQLKSPLYWLDGGGSNETGFSALPAGYYDGSIGRYMNLYGNTYFWSTGNGGTLGSASSYVISHECDELMGKEENKGLGFSVRCIKECDN